MATRPTSVGARPTTACSAADSTGVVSVALSFPNTSAAAEEVAEDMTLVVFDNVLSQQRSLGSTQELADLRLRNEQLQAELANARSELEFASLKEEELATRLETAQQAVDNLQQERSCLEAQLRQAQEQLKDAEGKLLRHAREQSELEENLSSSQRESAALQAQVSAAQAALQTAREDLEQVRRPTEGAEQSAQRELLLQEECAALRGRLESLGSELSEAQRELSDRKDFGKDAMSSVQATVELPPESSTEETPLLAAAYQQISTLNTQLAHLYTELTIARTEVQQLRAVDAEPRDAAPPATAPDSQKQSQQIADLVSDIRHLQLDLEYHQQKLDQMIEEKQHLLKEIKKCQAEVAETKLQVEARDQMLKHRDVDLAHLKQELMKSPRGAGRSDSSDGVLAALRNEAAAKDSALLVSHYELHKEKLVRERLEQKNIKLMERMQKLMMVVETMRKENVALERSLSVKDRLCEEKEVQLRQVTQKARQLHRLSKAPKAGPKGSSPRVPEMMLDLEVPLRDVLPPLDRSQRLVDSAAGRRSGRSTPRTPRTPRTGASPYGR